jgi:hypothetical protein
MALIAVYFLSRIIRPPAQKESCIVSLEEDVEFLGKMPDFVVMTGESKSKYQSLFVRALTVNPPKVGLWSSQGWTA